MSEMSDMFKLVNAMELAKTARVGMSLTYFDVIELLGEINSLYEYIAELESAQRWIPVSERLPDNWKSVLTIDISKSTRDMATAFYNPETSLWSNNFSWDSWVTHWMPLPEPPIVYGKERD